MEKFIKDIRDQEERISDGLNPALFGNLHNPQDQRAAARWLMQQGSPLRAHMADAPWGIYTRNIPILHQLLHQPVLLVDIHTHSKEPDPAEGIRARLPTDSRTNGLVGGQRTCRPAPLRSTQT